jgi:class 3 adenylate cyclase
MSMATATDDDAPTHSPSEWLEAVVDAERRAELLSACDIADRGLDEHPGDIPLQHRAVLALARAGSTEQAARRFEHYGLSGVESEDVRALEARIAKDIALAADDEERRLHAAQSAGLYEEIIDDTDGYYPGINAATLRLVSGDLDGARRLARQVLEIVLGRHDEGYYGAATEAEAHLLLDDVPRAGAALTRAATLHGGDYGAVATTRRQLRLVCEQRGIDHEVLDRLAGPRVIHYCGQRLGDGGPVSPALEQEVARAIEEEIDRQQPGYAYGSLGSGADILFAEALLARGVEVHVVLPFARDEFVQAFVADAGAEWSERFQRCLAAAAEVRYATDDAFLGDDVLFRYGAELAMGLALLRGRFLDADVHQIAVWDGLPAPGAAGTAIDIATWSGRGRTTTVLTPDALRRRPGPAARSSASDESGRRVVRALLFADIKGFSKLVDAQLPRFTRHVLGAVADVLARHDANVCYRNTWGDGLYVVLTGAEEAAACALELQDAVAGVDLAARGLPDHLALRLGSHLGPVFPVHDPVLGRDSFMGSHVSRTARIEPVTPPGAVFVTEPFAAALELADSPFACDYVGHLPAAKQFGRLRMYRLRRPAAKRDST